MASQRDIRRRIQSSKNIKQITRAMQFVAASKLKRAQDATLSARPYSQKIDELLADLAVVIGPEDHPLLVRREGGKRLIVLITSDRGLAGPFNTNTIRFAAQEITEHTGDLAVIDELAERLRPSHPRDRVGKRLADGLGHSSHPCARDAVGGTRRANTGAEQRLVGVDIPDAYDDVVRGAPQPSAVTVLAGFASLIVPHPARSGRRPASRTRSRSRRSS